VSILSTSAHGEGSLFQAYFKPQEITSRGGDSAEANWLGFLHGLWVDDHGNLREDNGDFELVFEEDPIVQFYFDGVNGTRIQRDYVSADDPYGDGLWDETGISMNDLRSMWEAGKELALREKFRPYGVELELLPNESRGLSVVAGEQYNMIDAS
jgi:hypothetical protein